MEPIKMTSGTKRRRRTLDKRRSVGGRRYLYNGMMR